MSDNDGEILALRQELMNLRQEIASLRNQRFTPFPQVFVAKKTSGGSLGVQWQEQVASGGGIADYVDGRKCTSDGDSSAMMLPVGTFIAVELTDTNSTRYMRVVERPIRSGQLATAYNGTGSVTVTPTISFGGASTGEANVACSVSAASSGNPTAMETGTPVLYAEHPTGGGILVGLNWGPAVEVKITSIVSGQVGRFNGKTIRGANVSASGNIAEADLGTVNGTENAIVWHLGAIVTGSTKHQLRLNQHVTGRVIGTNSGKIVVAVNNAEGETTSPTAVGSNAEGSEAANGTTWSQVSDGTPLDLWFTSRVGYFEAGDKTLYGYARKLSIDACGRVIAVTAETRYTIDVPEVCTT
jgi:hypothetical protein